MSKDSNTQQRANRQYPPTKIIVERRYVGTEKMETIFKRIAEEQITKKVKEIAENNTKITALYCSLSKDDGTNNESISLILLA